MKNSKITIAVAIAGGLALGYPAAAWVLGKRVEANFDESYRQLAETPYVKVVKRDYQRHLFSATETVTLELFGNFSTLLHPKTDETDDSNADAKAPAAEKIEITLRSEIKHGPLPGFSTIGAASIDTELLPEGKPMKELAKFWEGKKPLQVHTVYGFGGGGSAKLSNPGVLIKLPASEEGQESRQIRWDGLVADIDFEKGMKRFRLRADIPKLEGREGEGVLFSFTGLHIDADEKRLFDDEPMFYVGSGKMTLAELKLAKGKEGGPSQLLIKQFTYELNAPTQGDFIDLEAKIGAENLQLDSRVFSSVHYDLSLSHMHARSMAALRRTWMKLYSDPKALEGWTPGGNKKVFAALGAPLLELLKHSPEIRIDRISFANKLGEAKISAYARLKNAKPEEFSTPMLLLSRLDAGAEVSLPEAMVADSGESGLPEGMVQQLAGLEAGGFVSRNQGIVKSKIAFADGQLAINDKAVPLGAGALAAPK